MALIDKLTAIADAIRGKTGGTALLTLDDMAAAIAGIPSGGGSGLDYDMGEVVLENDTAGIPTISVNHQLGMTPGFILVWTDDFAGLSADNTATQQCNLGYLWLDRPMGLDQRLTAAATGTAMTINFFIPSGDYRINFALPNTTAYLAVSPTADMLYLYRIGNSHYWRAGITYKYFVSKAWWNVGGVENA